MPCPKLSSSDFLLWVNISSQNDFDDFFCFSYDRNLPYSFSLYYHDIPVSTSTPIYLYIFFKKIVFRVQQFLCFHCYPVYQFSLNPEKNAFPPPPVTLWMKACHFSWCFAQNSIPKERHRASKLIVLLIILNTSQKTWVEDKVSFLLLPLSSIQIFPIPLPGQNEHWVISPKNPPKHSTGLEYFCICLFSCVWGIQTNHLDHDFSS